MSETRNHRLKSLPTTICLQLLSAALSASGFSSRALIMSCCQLTLRCGNHQVDPVFLPVIAAALKGNGFDYLQCQGGYDEGPGAHLVCFYHLVAMAEVTEGKTDAVREVRVKVFLPRDGEPSLPSLYGLFRGADWQERETFDMFGIRFDGHPHPKRLLMPEDWKGWPLRKDYVQPDFYEMQDAY